MYYAVVVITDFPETAANNQPPTGVKWCNWRFVFIQHWKSCST